MFKSLCCVVSPIHICIAKTATAMGSISHDISDARGTFTVPVYDGEPHVPPAERPYFAPPKAKETIPVTFPVIDCRDDVFPGIDAGTTEAYAHAYKFLSQHGFTAIKHTSSLKNLDAFNDPDNITNTYYPEVCDIVKRVTGAKVVIPIFNVRRGGAPTEDPFPNGFQVSKAEKQDFKNMSKRSLPATPVRLPHCDYTPLGARGSVRAWMKELKDAAEEFGVIHREDEICSAANVDPMKKESDEIVAARYNEHGVLGPRYAAFSMWRGLKPVTRDPLAFSTYEEIENDGRFVVEPYLNRLPGLNGDWERELEMLKIKEDRKGAEGTLKWRYISRLQADELMFVKLFDSAGHLQRGPESDGVLHGSPDLGDAAYGDTRESIEVRVIAFW